MASIVLRSFGGMAPSANLKAADLSTASYAKNLDLRHTDFRPLPAPAALVSAAAGITLYKFDSGSAFITKNTEVNFVRGPIPTDTTERTYYTGDGVPKVTDLSGVVRQLGVPRPGAAPVVAVNVVAQFTTDESAKSAPFHQSIIQGILWDHRVYTYVGVDDSEISPNFVAISDSPWAFNFKIAGTLAGSVFTPTNPAHRNLMTEQLGFFYTTVGPTTTGYVPLFLRGAKLTFDSSLDDALAAIVDPSDFSGVRKLLTADQVTAILSNLTDGLKASDTARDVSITRIKSMKDEFVSIANATTASASGSYSAMQAFYNRSDVDAVCDAAVQRAVGAIYDAMLTFDAS